MSALLAFCAVSELNMTPNQNINSSTFRSGSTPEELPEDKLDREPLAQQLAQSIQQQGGTQSIVIGLSGQWGSGKSWLIARVGKILDENYTREFTRQPTPQAPPVSAPYLFEFKVWQWSGTDEILSQFFDQLGNSIQKVESDDRTRKMPKWKRWVFDLWLVQFVRAQWGKVTKTSTPEKLSAYAAWFEGHAKVVKGYNTGILGLVSLLTLLVGAGLYVKADWIPLAQGAVLAALLFVSGALTWLAELFSAKADSKKKFAEASQQSPCELKAGLKKRLKDLPNPIIVVLDDLDRLTASEVAHVFQLVKTQADFPNIHYLLGFDQKLIASALERIAPGVPGNGLPAKRGQEYLEKIVPVIFDLPAVSDEEIKDILCFDLEAVFKCPKGEIAQLERWSSLWRDGLSYFYDNLRDIDRLYNSLHFNVHLVGGSQPDVDLLDFVAIETLRIFEPEVFRSLSQNSETLTKNDRLEELIVANDSNPEANREHSERTRTKIQAIYAAARNKEAVESLLCQLFPNILKAIKNSTFGSYQTPYPAYAGRVNASAFFPRYFRYKIGPEEWASAEVNDLMKHIGDAQAFRGRFQEAADGQWKPQIQPKEHIVNARTPQDAAQIHWKHTLELADMVGQRLPKFNQTRSPSEIEQVERVAKSLLQAGMVLPTSRYLLFNQKMEQQMGSHAHGALRSIADLDQRTQVAFRLIDDPEHFASSMQLLLFEVGSHSDYPAQSNSFNRQLHLFDDAQLKQAQTLLTKRSQDALEASFGWHRPQVRLYLEALSLWEENDVRERNNQLLGQMLRDADRCFMLLEAFLDATEATPVGADHAYVSHQLLIVKALGGAKGLDFFVPLNVVEEQIPSLRDWLVQRIAQSAQKPETFMASALDSTLARRMLCWVGIANFFGSRQNPPVKTTSEEQWTILLTESLALLRSGSGQT